MRRSTTRCCLLLPPTPDSKQHFSVELLYGVRPRFRSAPVTTVPCAINSKRYMEILAAANGRAKRFESQKVSLMNRQGAMPEMKKFEIGDSVLVTYPAVFTEAKWPVFKPMPLHYCKTSTLHPYLSSSRSAHQEAHTCSSVVEAVSRAAASPSKLEARKTPTNAVPVLAPVG